MNKKAIILSIAVVIVGVTALYFLESRRDQQFESNLSSLEGSSGEVLSGEVSVDISNFSFKDEIIKVSRGSKVTWTNQDSAEHTVTSDDNGPLDSDLLDQGDTYEYTFDQTGTYRYHCTPHPGMKAAVIVVDE